MDSQQTANDPMSDKISVARQNIIEVPSDDVPKKVAGGDGHLPIKTWVTDEVTEVSVWLERKRANMRRMFVRLLTFTLLPTLLAAIYFGFIVTDRYVTEFQVMVNSPNAGVMSMFSVILGGGSGGGASNQENFVIEEFIQSQAALEKLDEQLDLRAHFSQDSIDAFSRLDVDATNEEFLAYYLSRISVANNATSQIIKVQVQAFSPEMAKTIADLLIILCDDLVNNFNEEAQRDTLAFAQSELDRAENRFRNVRLQVSNFRNREGDLNPVESAAAITAIISELEGGVAGTRVEIARVGAYMKSSSVQISALNDKLNALTGQVDAERERLVSTKGDAVDQRLYAKLLSEYESLMIEESMAQAAYMTATQGYQMARSDSSKQKHVYLVAFAPPILPDESLEPRRLYSILMVFVGALVFYMVGSFTWAAVREHIGA